MYVPRTLLLGVMLAASTNTSGGPQPAPKVTANNSSACGIRLL